MDSSCALRRLPSVEKVLVVCAADAAIRLPRALMAAIVRRRVDEMRQQCLAGEAVKADPLAAIRGELTRLSAMRLRKVINATGVLLHTNLGRAPMSEAAMAKVSEVAGHYCNAELDLTTGQRGGRGELVEEALAAACGAEAATVVNNCAGALVLILRGLVEGGRREVIVSRGELVEIGGGFRIPEIMETSGAVLREVGTTNRTRISDYERAVTPETAMVLKVHRSNFHMEGFVAEPDLGSLAELGRRHGLPVVGDLGSGALVDPGQWHDLDAEPSPGEWLAEGLDLVCVSGDKLMGGPQAGVIVGGRRWVEKLKQEAFFRALRCDKMVLGALQETVLQRLEEGVGGVRVHELLAADSEALRVRAEMLLEELQDVGVAIEIRPCVGKIGGGTMPQARVPSIALRIEGQGKRGAERLAERLRMASVPVVGYVEGDAVWLDLRTVMPEQDQEMCLGLRWALDGVIGAAG